MACSPIEGEFSEDRWPTGTSFDTKICHIGLNRKRLSLAKRTAIGLARFLLVNGIGVAATLAWQSYGDEIREFVAKSYPQLDWVAPETAFAKAAPEMARIIPSAASPDRQEFEGMSVALAAVQQRVNRLAAEFVTSQEQMISDIAKLKADERVILAKLSLATFTPASRSPVPVATTKSIQESPER